MALFPIYMKVSLEQYDSVSLTTHLTALLCC